jgi:hypothetical protein
MAMLHDAAVRNGIERRLATLHPDSPRQWGTMTPGQMLWHVNEFLAAALGEGTMPQQKTPLPLPIMRFLLLYLPWPKSAPTNKGAVATGTPDFAAERARCQALIAKFASRPVDGPWPVDPTWGAVSGAFASKLQAKHLDHHLRQFGA